MSTESTANTTPEKPILLRREDLIETIVNAVNTSGLPMVIVVPVLEGILQEAKTALEKQYAQEKAEYEAAQKETNLKGDETNAEATN